MSRQSTMFEMFADSDATSSPPDGHAREIAWLDGVLEWLTNEADCGGKSSAYLPSSVPLGFLAKTSLEFCQSTGEEIGLPSSGTWRNSGLGMRGACLTLNLPEFHRDAVVCSLSQILETGPIPEKYYLSPKSARGILRRVEKRGRALPEALAVALEAVASVESGAANQASRVE